MRLNFIIFWLLFPSVILAQDVSHPNHIVSQNGKLPLKQGHIHQNTRFVENKNQWDKSVKFRVDIPDGFLFLKSDGLQYIFYDAEAISGRHTNLRKTYSDQIKAHAINVNFLNTAQPKTQEALGFNASSHKRNYFLGDNPAHWASNVSAYSEVFYPELYPKIGLKIYEYSNTLKYEFIVGKNANPEQIVLQYEGATSIKIENEALVIETSLNQFMERKPYCYQKINGQEIHVPAKFVLENNIVRFAFPNGYNPDYELIIDPVLVFSTYSGSTADNWGSTATYDDEGNLYSGGIVFGSGFPIRPNPGAFDVSFNGSIDIGVLKFNSTGTNIIYSTYIGGNSSEFPHSLVTNQNDELFILGTTSSNNFPTQNAFDATFNGGPSTLQVISGIDYSNGSDIVITRLNSAGSALIGSTYLGGSNNDGINTATTFGIRNYGDQFRGEIFIDSTGYVYIASMTNSTNFPIKNAFQSSLSGGQEGVVIKMHQNLRDMSWATYLGGNNVDALYSVKVTNDGNVYACGGTRSTNLRQNLSVGTPNAFLNTIQGNDDGYVARMDTTGKVLQVSYIGTNNQDQTFFVDIDPEENVYVLGQTNGAYPVINANYRNPNSGQFIQKLNKELTQGLLSTVIGRGDGNPDISPTAFLVNDCGNLYLAGWGSAVGGGTFSLTTNGLPTTTDAYARTTDNNDFYIIILEKNAQSLLYATFFGGTSSNDHVDGGTSRFDKAGIIYHAACASCGGNRQDFPTTPGAWSRTNNSPNCNNGAFKFDIGTLQADFSTIDAAIGTKITNACTFPIDVLIDFTGKNVTFWQWDIFRKGETSSLYSTTDEDFQFPFLLNGDYDIRLIAQNPVSCLKADTVVRPFRVSVIGVDDSYEEKICFGQNTQLQASVNSTNPYSIQWSPAVGLSQNNILNPVAAPTQTTTYTLTVTDDNNCIAQKTVKIEVEPPLNPDFNIIDNSNVQTNRICLPATATLNFNATQAGADNWIWEIEGLGTFNNQEIVNFNLTTPGKYKAKLTASRGGLCPETKIVEKEIFVSSLDVDATGDATVCRDVPVQLDGLPNSSFGNVMTYQWIPATGLSNAQIKNPIATPDNTTTYTLRVTNEYGCQATDQVTVTIAPTPRIDFDLATSTDCAKPTTITFENRTTEAESFMWTIRKGSEIIVQFNDQNPPPYNFTKAGTYEVELRAFTGSCEKIEVKTVEIENNQTLPPNIITPNEDTKNQFFVLDDRLNYKLEIFNRWGGLVFKSDNYQNDWGKGVENGMYYYLLTSPSGVKCKGWIQVVK